MISCSLEAINNIPCLLLTLATILTVTLLIRNKQQRSKPAAGLNLPPGPWQLPIIGNIHQLIGHRQPHRRLRSLAHKYGPDVMSLQLGELSYIVISTPEAAQQVMKTHDLEFASRPSLLAPNVLFNGCKDIAFAPYGEYWRQMRKIGVLELFSGKRVQSFRRVREEEVSNLVDSIALLAETGEAVDLTSMMSAVTSAVTSRAAFGKAPELSDAFMMVVDHISDVIAGFKISDLYPSFESLPVLTGYRARLDRMREASHSILDRIIDEHKSRRRRAGLIEEDMVDVLLNHQENQDLGIPITDEVIKGVTLVSMLELFLAGIDTSTTAFEWIMSEMIVNPTVLKRAQEEVRQVFADGSVDEAGLRQLKYLDMVISEGLRLHPPVPLLLPRENAEKATLDAYDIPINTKVIVNAWTINRDSRYWTEPEKFYPERFMDGSVDYRGTHFQFIPFGAGRRMCPGMSFSLAIVKLTLASLLFHFRWRVPTEMTREGLDMTECFGAALRRKNALRLIPVLFDDIA
ncbi:unnamed protein product [Linum tenue]|uniref:Cytochrome P450 n=1 Tax=Linum tenue TaxID=586396 RepID=A0AAV0ILC3_9ROSI|nr:unnamed protein product [Linum tenue]